MAGRPEKYVALRTHLEKKARELRDSGEVDLKMKFKQIEDLGVRLPPSAYNHRAWWANNQNNSLSALVRETAEKPWQRAKFETAYVDKKRGELTFRYFGSFSPEGRARQAEREAEKKRAHELRIQQWRLQRRAAANAAPADSALSPGLADITRPYSVPEKVESGVPRRSRHPLHGALKGHIRLVAGTDLAKPANPHGGRDKP